MISAEDQARLDLGETFLAHHGVRGMKWGVRKSDPGGGSGGSSKTASAARSVGKSAAGAAGKSAAIAIVAVAGGLAVSSLAGPIAGSAAGAALRGALGVGLSTRSADSSFTNGPSIKIKGQTADGLYNITDPSGRNMSVDHNILEQMLNQT